MIYARKFEWRFRVIEFEQGEIRSMVNSNTRSVTLRPYSPVLEF